ncbi:MAG: hypothetical protein ACR2LI_08860 [Propionibacteriaceae bacterium]
MKRSPPPTSGDAVPQHDSSWSDPVPDSPDRTWRRADAVALATALALVATAHVVGTRLLAAGRPMVLPWPPLVASWFPHWGWGSPLAVVCVAVGILLQRRAALVSWRRLLAAGWTLSLAWMISLTLIDGLHRGWVSVLLDPNEYLKELPRINNPATFLQTFTHYIAFGGDVDGTNVWTTHVAGHPPLATLVFWALDRVGLGGGFFAGALCILASSMVAIGLPVTLRSLGAEDAARRAVPFVALFPGAVWMAVSADGLFAGVAVGGLALACVGATRRRPPSSLLPSLLSSLLGGLLLGAAVFLNYGLVLFGIVVVVVAALTVIRLGLRAVVVPWLVATVGVLTVAGAHLALGFNWVDGLIQLRVRYYQGIASDRPYSYFVWANLAAWLISCSPLLAIGVVRAVGVLVGRPRRAWSPDVVAAALGLSGVACALVATASGLSKAETERIWLAFGVVAVATLSLLRGRAACWALLGSATTALLVNHLLYTGW